MKKLLLGLALLIPCHVYATDNDSVYSWGAWAQGIRPAAGPSITITPAPVDMPKVEFRPNENPAFSRTTVDPEIAPVVPTGGSRPADTPAPITRPGDRF
jgi:hypothetical protein